MSIELSDQDILSHLTNTEDSTVERKAASDYRDCLKTAVAFSNSLPVDDPGIIFVAVFDDGRVEGHPNLDKLQKDVSKELSKVYPPIYPQMKVMRNTEGKEFLAVIVRGSANKPHFAGQSYIRDGSQTVMASKEQFERLIAERNSKARELLKWCGKEIRLRMPQGEAVIVGGTVFGGGGRLMCRLVDCGQFYVTIEISRENESIQLAYPLSFVEIGFDCEKSCLELYTLVR